MPDERTIYDIIEDMKALLTEAEELSGEPAQVHAEWDKENKGYV